MVELDQNLARLLESKVICSEVRID